MNEEARRQLTVKFLFSSLDTRLGLRVAPFVALF
jgi:hypothetical protein